MSVLEAKALTKRYGHRAVVDSLTLSVAAGEIFCLLGPNGAGKTTTINLFLGFTRPDAGHAYIKGIDVTRAPLETKRSLAYIPEQVALYASLSGRENLAFFADLSGIRVTASDTDALFDEVGLARAAASARVETYSKGMRQKVAIAIAIATGADVLLLDEPTSGLDPAAANEFSRLLERMRVRGAAVLMATHDLYRAKTFGTHLGIMSAGRLMTTMRAEAIETDALEALYLEIAEPPARPRD
jgi:ABC-2 type transport system ATP-binding protein